MVPTNASKSKDLKKASDKSHPAKSPPPPPSQQPKKILSRATLYASLASYNNNNNANKTKTIPESALYDFWQHVSSHHHYHHGTNVGTLKNTGGRPLNATEILERLKLRTLTLVGNGYNNNKHRVSSLHSSNARRKRKRDKSLLETKHDASWHSQQLTHLQELNRLWNSYMLNMLHKSILSSIRTDTSSAFHLLQQRQKVMEFLSTHHANVEWIGARVVTRVVIPNKNAPHNCIEGILIGETVNTWSIATVIQSSQDKKVKEEDSSKETSDETTLAPPTKDQQATTTTRFVIKTVPKNSETLLAVEIPLWLNDETKTDDDDNDASSRPVLCIHLNGGA